MQRYRICLLLFIGGVAAQNYLWPTSADPFLSSSFCEFRPGHYHSGIDIKTWNREGYSCYAIDDGVIEKIRVSPFGYGKVIYLRLQDRNIAVYAHLQRFTEKIDRMVRAIQLKNKKYRLNWNPENLRVKRGDVIGYTGRTGIGVPHLHFEIRNRNEQPLNPLAYYNQIKDTIRPQLQEIAVLPVAPAATINHSFLPQVFELEYMNKGRYRIKEPMRVRGTVGLAVKGYDQANGVPNTFAFYQTKMLLDGREVFSITYDKLDFAETSYIDAEIHHPFWANDRKVFHKLYIDPYNALSLYSRYVETDGSITVADQMRTFIIRVTDYHGNISTIEGTLVPVTPGLENITYIQKLDDWLYLKLSTARMNALHFFSGRDINTWTPVDNFEIMGRYQDNPGETLLLKFNLSDHTQTLMKVAVPGQEVVLPLRGYGDSLDVRAQFLGKYIIFTFNRPCAGIQLIAKQQNGFGRIKRIVSGSNQTYLSAREIETGPLYLTLQADKDTLWHDRVEMARLLPGRNQKFNWFDSTVILETGASAVFDTTLIEIKQAEPDDTQIAEPVFGKYVEILPDDLALLSNARIHLKAHMLPTDKQWAVFAIAGDKLSYLSHTYEAGYFIFGTKSLGKFIIASDTVAPELQIRTPEREKQYTKNPAINFSVSDALSGVDGEEGISIMVDSIFVLPEWDPEDDLVHAAIDDPLLPGRHRLYIEVKDFLQNAVRDTIQFYTQ